MNFTKKKKNITFCEYYALMTSLWSLMKTKNTLFISLYSLQQIIEPINFGGCFSFKMFLLFWFLILDYIINMILCREMLMLTHYDM